MVRHKAPVFLTIASLFCGWSALRNKGDMALAYVATAIFLLAAAVVWYVLQLAKVRHGYDAHELRLLSGRAARCSMIVFFLSLIINMLIEPDTGLWSPQTTAYAVSSLLIAYAAATCFYLRQATRADC